MKKYAFYFLTEFEELKRNFGEPVSDFIKRFNKLYHKMPPDCKPPVAATKSRFSKAFEDDFVVMLREGTSRTLEDMQTNAIEVEANSATSATLKDKEEKAQRKLKSSQEAYTSSTTKTEDSKIDERTSLRNISNRISKIETQPRTVQQTVTRPQNQNQGQYKRNPPLQILQRPSNNQQVPTPLPIDEQSRVDNTMTITEDIKNLDTSSSQTTIIPLSQQKQI